jgi:hypothetical protein
MISKYSDKTLTRSPAAPNKLKCETPRAWP